MRLAWAGLVVPLALAGGAVDRVQLKSGDVLTGRVVFQDSSVLILRQDERDKSLERATIERVESRAVDLSALLDDAAAADLANPAELARLAARATESGLSGEAQVFWWRLVLLDPAREDAHRALGHVRRGSGWVIPVKGRQVDWEKRLELARDWGTGWELTSLHYELHSNLPLDQSLAALLDLERLLRAFYQVFGADLGLYDLTRPLGVSLHADSASYPESGGESGIYDSDEDVVHIDAEKGLRLGVLAHEATHQLLYDTAFRSRTLSSGQIPPWLNEGLASYVAGCVLQAPGRLAFEPGRPEPSYFRTQAEARRPFDLTRVLAFSTGDYFASSDRDLKYAQSYTLVHFLLHAGEGRHRAGFLDFLRAVYAGKGSATDLKRALDVDWRQLEEEWIAYVRARAL